MYQKFHQTPSKYDFNEKFDAFEMNQNFKKIKKEAKNHFDGV